MEANDMKAMREALENIVGYAETARFRTEDVHILSFLGEIEGWARSALSKPPRQCDVGTAEEQMKRQYDTMCNTTKACPDSDWSCRECFAKWAQMPYTAERKGEVEARGAGALKGNAGSAQ